MSSKSQLIYVLARHTICLARTKERVPRRCFESGMATEHGFHFRLVAGGDPHFIYCRVVVKEKPLIPTPTRAPGAGANLTPNNTYLTS